MLPLKEGRLLAHDFEHLRAQRLATHLENMPVDLVDPPDFTSEQEADGSVSGSLTEPAVVRMMVTETTSHALGLLLEERSDLAELTPADVQRAAAARLFDPDNDGGLGANMSRASRLTEIWHRDNRYTLLAGICRRSSSRNSVISTYIRMEIWCASPG